jgi:hypothetical protein
VPVGPREVRFEDELRRALRGGIGEPRAGQRTRYEVLKPRDGYTRGRLVVLPASMLLIQSSIVFQWRLQNETASTPPVQ